jgi:CRP/FNR family cyclic AMP-dependent transcriptional regulator
VAKTKKLPFNVRAFLNTVDGGRTVATYRKDQRVFSQGDPADSAFFIQKGKVKVYVVSEQARRRSSPSMGVETFLAKAA